MMSSATWSRGAQQLSEFLLISIFSVALFGAGGWSIPVLSLLTVLSLLLAVVLIIRPPRFLPWLAIVFVGLAGFALLQLTSLGSVLALVSPKAAEIRATTVGAGAGPVTYETAATARELLKYLLYGLFALGVWDLVQRRGSEHVALGFIWATGMSILLAIGHRGLGMTELFGIVPWKTGPQWPTTTLVNPNHAATLLGTTALVTFGLASRRKRMGLKCVYWALSTACLAASIAQGSTMGIAALSLVLVFEMIIWWRPPEREGWLPWSSAASSLAMLGGAAILGAWLIRKPAFAHQADVKWDGIRDAGRLIVDHWVVGAGRGSFVSIYPHYKRSELNLTFTFPENFFIQHLSELGSILGGMVCLLWIALAVWLLGTWRGSMYRHWIQLAAFFIMLREFSDFATELPAIMFLWIGLLAATHVGRLSSFHVDRAIFRGGLALGTVGIGWAIFAARSNHLPHDLKRLEAVIVSQRSEDELVTARRLAEAHPANGVAWARFALIAEEIAPREALQAVSAAMYLNPTFPDAHVIAGRLLARAGRRAQAMGEFRLAWELAWDEARVASPILRAVRDATELQLVLPRMRDGLTVEPPALLLAARLLQRMGSVDLMQALSDHLPPPDLVERDKDLFRLAALAEALGRPDEGLEYLRMMVERLPTDARAVAELGRALVERGEMDEAKGLLGSLSDAIGREPELGLFRLELAIKTGSETEVMELFDELSIRSSKGSQRVRMTSLVARYMLDQGRPDEALKVLSRMLLTEPSSNELRWLRATAARRLSRPALARRDLEQILERDPSHESARDLLRRLEQGESTPQ